MTVKVSLTVNGKPASAEVEERTLLVNFIRDTLRLTGTHVGCDTAQCGACTIHMNGRAVKSCNMLAMQAEGADLVTIEGIAKADGTLHPMQEAFRQHHGLQCGFCTPGMVMSAIDLVKNFPDPSEELISEQRDGNLCRCTGASIKRKEDYRFRTGAGNYTDDVALPRQTHAHFVRSPHAHAKIKSIKKDKALKAPGVVAVFTGDDLAGAKVNGLPCGWLITDVNGQPMKEPPHPCLAQGKARYVGDHIAIVIAESYQQARDAAELIKVEYEELPAVVRAGEARKKGAPVVHDIAPDNTCYVWGLGDKAAVEKAFSAA